MRSILYRAKGSAATDERECSEVTFFNILRRDDARVLYCWSTQYRFIIHEGSLKTLDELHHQVRACTDCPLHLTRFQAVPGEGASFAQIMFVGEGPGFQEDRFGRPFVGPAGMFLNELLESAGLRRQDVFITNLVKCRPPNNRDPLPNEIEACNNHLKNQIQIINPRVIIPLGRHAMAHWFPSGRIGELHGRPHRVGDLIVLPLYHPAAALHNGSLRETIMRDFQILSGLLGDPDIPIRKETAQNSPDGKQLNMW